LYIQYDGTSSPLDILGLRHQIELLQRTRPHVGLAKTNRCQEIASRVNEPDGDAAHALGSEGQTDPKLLSASLDDERRHAIETDRREQCGEQAESPGSNAMRRSVSSVSSSCPSTVFIPLTGIAESSGRTSLRTMP
jgi:hypothetical protein